MLHKWRVMNICVGYNDTLIHTGASIALIKWYVSDRGLVVISTTELVVPGLHWATREMCLVMKNGFEMFMKTLENNDGIKYGIYIMLKRSHSHSYLTAMWHYVCCTSLFLCVSVSLSLFSLWVCRIHHCVCAAWAPTRFRFPLLGRRRYFCEIDERLFFWKSKLNVTYPYDVGDLIV